MNYRHSYHAGNSADVLKHIVLIALIRALQLKEGALTLIDTHAGCGLYDLLGDDASRTAEAEQGIGRVWGDPSPVLTDYLKLVADLNAPDSLRRYPGSPLVMAKLLRSQDRLVVNELHPEDVRELRHSLRNTPAQVHARDAYEFWLAMVPPQASRGLVLVDPPYEQTDERQRITAALAAASRKWAQGVTCIWYPLKDQPGQWRWEEALRAIGLPKLLKIELVQQRISGARLSATGLYIVNPPYAFVQALPPMLDALSAALQGTISHDWLSKDD